MTSQTPPIRQEGTPSRPVAPPSPPPPTPNLFEALAKACLSAEELDSPRKALASHGLCLITVDVKFPPPQDSTGPVWFGIRLCHSSGEWIGQGAPEWGEGRPFYEIQTSVLDRVAKSLLLYGLGTPVIQASSVFQPDALQAESNCDGAGEQRYEPISGGDPATDLEEAWPNPWEIGPAAFGTCPDGQPQALWDEEVGKALEEMNASGLTEDQARGFLQTIQAAFKAKSLDFVLKARKHLKQGRFAQEVPA